MRSKYNSIVRLSYPRCQPHKNSMLIFSEFRKGGSNSDDEFESTIYSILMNNVSFNILRSYLYQLNNFYWNNMSQSD